MPPQNDDQSDQTNLNPDQPQDVQPDMPPTPDQYGVPAPASDSNPLADQPDTAESLKLDDDASGALATPGQVADPLVTPATDLQLPQTSETPSENESVLPPVDPTPSDDEPGEDQPEDPAV